MLSGDNLFQLCAYLIGFISFHLVRRKNILMGQFAANCLYCMHYLVSGFFFGATYNAICSIQNIIFANREIKILKSKVYSYVFSVMIIATGIVWWKGPATILFMVGHIIAAFGFNQRSTRGIRKMAVLSSVVLMAYCLITSNIAVAIYEFLIFASALSSFFLIKDRRRR